MLTWQSVEVVPEVDCSTKLRRVLSWVSDTGRTHCEKAIENESALQAYSLFSTHKIGLSCQKPSHEGQWTVGEEYYMYMLIDTWGRFADRWGRFAEGCVLRGFWS